VVDVFEEVEGELRSERYRQLALKLLPWALAGLFAGLLIVGGVWAVTNARERTAAEASQTYSDALSLAESGDLEGAYVQFDKVSNQAKSYKALALMHQGAIRLQQGKAKDAAALFDRAAETAPGGDLGTIISDAARLKSALALLDDASFADIEARLKPLTETGRPYRPLAREALAFAKLKAGKVKEAREDFAFLRLMQDAPQGVRDRANGTIAVIDSGLAVNTAAVAKAAAALPPPPAAPQGLPAGMSPEQLQQLMQQMGAQGGPGGPPQGAPPQGGSPQ